MSKNLILTLSLTSSQKIKFQTIKMFANSIHEAHVASDSC